MRPKTLACPQPKQSAKRKRLQKGSGKSKASSSAATEEGGVVYENAYEDADKDSIDGSEAMEDNTPEDGEGAMFAKKTRRGGAPQIPRPVMNTEIRELQERMDTARLEDDEALTNNQQAVMKVAMMAEVAALMRKRHYHEAMIDCGILTSLAQWLKPMDDG